MPGKLFEVRWHGRAGQGAKSASQMLAEAALDMGKYIQAFPEYGAERTGAPMKAFNRISDEPILLHSSVEKPDLVVVIDDTLLGNPDIVAGTDENTIMIVNTVRDSNWVRQKSGFKGKICVVKATDIALEELGRGTPNTVMLGAIARVTGVIELKYVEEKIRDMFLKKFGEEVVQKNIRALHRGYEEVRCDA
ncbi:2-oxoacid:acceptor oxidoreductase family protein [Fervidobacterium thailandense]|uniref:Pyruvate synthase n=1 Tax=Fervidobacterium thailandense TaxID=1008305 RepID=A0A1E3G2E4_9BACT|nr:2-oxoacid:acceptor oxidoreductase family protein [Fervidobacterium thailandense]ODN30419.1 pyruvate synthase [Fervidobacterium thailandense]